MGSDSQNLGKSARIRIVLWALVLIGLLGAWRAASHRSAVERTNRSVEIALDYTELRNLAAAQGQPLATVLRAFKDAGATSVAIQEETVASLEDARLIRESEPDSRGVTVLYGRPSTIQRVQDALEAKTKYAVTLLPLLTQTASDDEPARRRSRHHTRVTLISTVSAPTPVDIPASFTAGLRIAEPPSLVRGVGIGLPPDAVAAVRAAGLEIVGRVGNWQGVTPDGIRWTLSQLQRDGVSTLVFIGDEVLGYKGYVAPDPTAPKDAAAPVTTAGLLPEYHLYYGTVEFGKMKGDPELAKAAEDRLVRVHTVTGSEMQLATIPGNIERFELAARERDIRLLYIRLFPSEPNALEVNTKDYVTAIANGLRSRHKDGRPMLFRHGDLVPGMAHGYPALHTSTRLRLVMAVGVAAGWLLLLDAVVGLFGAGAVGWGMWAFALLVAVALLVLPAAPGHTGFKLDALMAAIIFPSLALLRSDLLRPATTRGMAFGVALMRFAKSCAVTAIGIVLLVGLLADRSFLLKIDAFAGIKAAKLLPLLIVAVIYGLDLRATPKRTWAQAVRRFRERLVRLGSQPLIVWQVAATLLAFIVLALVMLRSGNDPGIGVSPMELKIRSLLDHLLPTRPRFQEFLIGQPALILSLFLAAAGRRQWAYYLFLVGAIGQVSMLNTFCHIHTPLAVSLWRAVLGVGIGTAIALIVYVPLNAIEKRLPPPPARVDE